MKPHPLEFRQRIIAAVDRQEHTIEEVAALFGVSERYVYQLLKLRRETRDLSPAFTFSQRICQPDCAGVFAKIQEHSPRFKGDISQLRIFAK
jgi:hypothetical protein